MIYNPKNWYWVVGGSTTQVWSSATAAYVPITDATYTAWLAAGNTATLIDSEASLQTVLSAQYPAGWPAQSTPSEQATEALANGLLVTFTISTHLTSTYKTDLESQLNIIGESTYLSSPGNTTQSFIGGDTNLTLYDQEGQPRVMSVPIFLAFEAAYAAWVKQVKTVRDSNTGPLPATSITVAI